MVSFLLKNQKKKKKCAFIKKSYSIYLFFFFLFVLSFPFFSIFFFVTFFLNFDSKIYNFNISKRLNKIFKFLKKKVFLKRRRTKKKKQKKNSSFLQFPKKNFVRHSIKQQKERRNGENV
jgi:hypothetical protein